MYVPKSAFAVAVVALVTFASGCGSNDQDPSNATQTTSETTGTTPDAGRSTLRTTIRVRVVAPDGPTQLPKQHVEVKPGDVVQLVTSTTGHISEGERVRIVVPTASRGTLRLQAGAEGSKSRSRATIRGLDGAVRLDRLRYTCLIPPAGFCPLDASRDGDAYMLIATPTRVPIIFAANVVAAK